MKNYYNIPNSYETYKKVSKKPISKVEYVKILNDFMLFLTKKLFEVGEILLPARLGILKIVGSKIKVKTENGTIKGLAPDWVKTKKLWDSDIEAKNKKQLVYHFNEETNGIRYRFVWSKKRIFLNNKTLYVLKMTRKNKRTLSNLVKNSKEYLIVK